MITTSYKATVHGAVSIVNAIATGKGAALGISLETTAILNIKKGGGRLICHPNKNTLFNYIVDSVIPKKIRQENDIYLSINSNIPIGVGLKSSSAVSSAVSLACHSLLSDQLNDFDILNTAVESSKLAKITITGAFDDSTACYFGGIVLTNNYSNILMKREPVPKDIRVVILVPNNTERKNVMKLIYFPDLFNKAFELADLDYLIAMKLNGVLISAIMSYNYEPILSSLEKGALSASISGNGPAIAVIARDKDTEEIKLNLERYGEVFICEINNKKAKVEKIIG
jgi:shikimate kinase